MEEGCRTLGSSMMVWSGGGEMEKIIRHSVSVHLKIKFRLARRTEVVIFNNGKVESSLIINTTPVSMGADRFPSLWM